MKELNPKDRILRLPEVKALTGLSRSSIYAFVKNGTFPPNYKLGERSVGWFQSEIESWLSERTSIDNKGA